MEPKFIPLSLPHVRPDGCPLLGPFCPLHSLTESLGTVGK